MQHTTPARGAFATVTTLFFTWGFITAMIDPLIPAVRAIFELSYAESMLTQFAFFMAYGAISLPAALLVARRGYVASMLWALGAMLLGCVLVLVATHVKRYEVVLAALFVIASGITVLQVAANPLAAVLGPPERSHFRLTFSQAFNSLGTVIGPYLGAMLMLRGGVFVSADDRSDAVREASLRNIDHSFIAIAILIGLLAAFIAISRRRIAGSAAPPASGTTSILPALRSRWALFGGLAIFLYVGAEVSIGSVLINFLHQPTVLNISLESAGRLLSLYWLGAMIGRFVGSWLLTRVAAARLTLTAAVSAATLCLVVTQAAGVSAAAAALLVGAFNSIMFPTIFTLTLERSEASIASTSGLLCMSIVGGAVLPPLVGWTADRWGLHLAFFVPMFAYLVIASFARAADRGREFRVVADVGNVH